MSGKVTLTLGYRLSFCRIEEDDNVGELGPKEVAARILFAPINPSDINQVNY